MIVRSDDGDNPGQAQHVPAVCHCGSGRFMGIAIAPEIGKKGEAQVNVLQRLPLDETADAQRRCAVAQLDQAQAKP